MNLIDCLKNNAERNPTKIGFIDEERSLTFKEMYDEVQKFSENISKFIVPTTKVVSIVSVSYTHLTLQTKRIV